MSYLCPAWQSLFGRDDEWFVVVMRHRVEHAHRGNRPAAPEDATSKQRGTRLILTMSTQPN